MSRETVWLNEAIGLFCISFDVNMSVNTGKAVLHMPSDVLQILRKRKVFVEANDKVYFFYRKKIAIEVLAHEKSSLEIKEREC